MTRHTILFPPKAPQSPVQKPGAAVVEALQKQNLFLLCENNKLLNSGNNAEEKR
jgi:hypothetical protein